MIVLYDGNLTFDIRSRWKQWTHQLLLAAASITGLLAFVARAVLVFAAVVVG
jgi:hypothetical protein